MAGVLFVICVPTEGYEKKFKNSNKEIIVAETDCVEFSEQNINVPSTEKQTVNVPYSSTRFFISEESVDVARLVSPIPKSKSADVLDSEAAEDVIPPVTKPYKSWDGFDAINYSAKYENEEEVDTRDADLPLETVLRKILKKQKIKTAVWTKGESGNYLQVIFPLESGGQCERTLAVLNECGIGQRLNSVVSVIPCSLYYKADPEADADSDRFGSSQEERQQQIAKSTGWNRFVTSVRARLTVAQVVESVKADAALTFDFLVLLLIATILSAIALAENNNVYLVSSMLISPMMGPVMAGTFGSVIGDRRLQRTGVLSELLGLGVAAAVGFCYGVIITSLADRYGNGDWPTYEMVSRGETRSLWVGCLIALLSGAAVALGILGDNIASLVGVAISASLMPPAVNAGLLWGMATVYACAGENSSKSLVRTHLYSVDAVCELAALGAVSMCLTFVNIVCIYLAGILVFKIKEVAPISSKDQSRRFWKYDIKIARDYNRTLQKEEARVVGSRLSDLQHPHTHTIYHHDHNQQYHSTEHARDHVIHIANIQNTWSPSTLQPKRPTIQELQSLYFSLVDKSKAQRTLNFRIPANKVSPSANQNSNDDALPCIPEYEIRDVPIPIIPQLLVSPNNAVNPVSVRRSKKFVVTPACLDIPTDTSHK